LAGKVRAETVQAFRNGTRPKVEGLIKTVLFPEVRDAMIASHLAGVRRSQLMTKSLRLSGYDSMIEKLAKLQGADLHHLQAIYGTEASQVVNNLAATVSSRMTVAVDQLLEEGAHFTEGIKALNEQFAAAGITGRQGHQLETMFRTQTQMAFGAGRYKADQDPVIQEILWGYEYSATMDDRTRPEHEDINRTRLPKDDPFWDMWWPPNGWNCRCQLIPIFQEERIIRPPEGMLPDAAFQFNPGKTLAA
jgi:SPP1 gp7 family putative phage head morphogenesis protein